MSTTLSHLGQATTSHAAFQIRTGQMENALHFFKELRWLEIDEAIVKGVWGQARFIAHRKNHDFTIQLTELSDGDPEKLEMTENHLAIHFSKADPQHAAEYILSWAVRAGSGRGSSIEPANSEGTKWFVYLPALFKFALEIV